MTEGIADAYDDPTHEHATLYGRWADGGAGVLLTGNVMVDRRYLERPGNVVLDDRTDRDALAAWAKAGTRNGAHFWMQLSHPGRQCQRTTAAQPVAPSAVGLKMMGLFGKPRALTRPEIREIISRFAHAATLARDAGFTGVQIHSAHGYLGSQFLSPLVNQRGDEYGGSLENRARFVLETVDAVRSAVGDDYPIAVKINSSDFQKGAFSNEDAVRVATMLAQRGIDMLEVSGGTYENIVFITTGDERAEGTRRREAYFLEYAEHIREKIDVPLMVTGGFRTREVMEEVLQRGELDMLGIARPFCVLPDCADRLIDEALQTLPSPEKDHRLGPGRIGPGSPNRTVRALNSQASVAWFYHQIYRLAAGDQPDLDYGVRRALGAHLLREQRKALARKDPK
jgi:2,4-dienoyl-CoA reductase-like NADH-dependent reductase (Old Yellow Enzyme family)